MTSTLGTTESAYDKMLDLNVKAPFMMCKEAVPHMSDGSSILFVSSYAGFIPDPMLGIYGVTKTALLGLTKALAKELGSSGIRVNCICPGLIKTKMSEMIWSNDDVAATVTQSSMLGRAGTPEECAGIASFLCSADASYMTGENVVVAGGISGRL